MKITLNFSKYKYNVGFIIEEKIINSLHYSFFLSIFTKNLRLICIKDGYR